MKKIIKENDKRFKRPSYPLVRKSSKRYKDTKSVAQYTLDGVFINAYRTAEEATEETGVFFGNIREVCRGNRKSAGGYSWRYVTVDRDGNAFQSCNCCGTPFRKGDLVNISVDCLRKLKYGTKEVTLTRL